MNGDFGERYLPCGEQNHPRSDLKTETFPSLGDYPSMAKSTETAKQRESQPRPSIFAQPTDSLLTEDLEKKESAKGGIQAGVFPMEVDPQMAYLEGSINPDRITNRAWKTHSLDHPVEIPYSSNTLISATGSEEGDLGVIYATKDGRTKKQECNQGKNISDCCFLGKREGEFTGHYQKEISDPIIKSASPSLRRRKIWARQSRKIPKINVQVPVKVQSPIISKRHRHEDESQELTGVERKAKVQKPHSANGEGDFSHESINTTPTAEAVMQPCRAP
ncbi:hypothetical protein U1Q18_009617 [Sarracenia purpurea var. burkii]